MIKFVANEVWAVDAEWISDVPTGRRVYDLGPEVTDLDVLHLMYREGGASEEEPRPYLKTVLCRVVSVAALIRHKDDNNGSVSHRLVSLPRYGAPAMNAHPPRAPFGQGAQPQWVKNQNCRGGTENRGFTLKGL